MGWEGYLFPVRYVEPLQGFSTEEGYRLRVNRHTWSREGKCVGRMSNGKKHFEGYYHHDYKVGTWTYWDQGDDGKLHEVDEYSPEGLPVRKTSYNPKGECRMVAEYLDGRPVRTIYYENGSVVRVVLPPSEEDLDPDPPESKIPPRDDLAKAPPPRPAAEPNGHHLVKAVVNSLGMRLVLIPPGSFMMGNSHSPKEEVACLKPYYNQWVKRQQFYDEYPRHRVRITRPFYLGACEVTVGQFRRFVAGTGYRTDAERGKGGGQGFDPKADGRWSDGPQFSCATWVFRSRTSTRW